MRSPRATSTASTDPYGSGVVTPVAELVDPMMREAHVQQGSLSAAPNMASSGSGAEPRLLEEAAAGDGSLEQLQLVVGGGGGPSSSGSSSSAASTLKVRVPRDTLSAAYAHCLSLSPRRKRRNPVPNAGGAGGGARSGGPGA